MDHTAVSIFNLKLFFFFNAYQTSGALTSVKVTGLPTNVNDEEVELYFETQKSGGRKGSIRKCVIENNGVAFLEFDDPEGTAVNHTVQTHHYAHTNTLNSLAHNTYIHCTWYFMYMYRLNCSFFSH